MDLYKILLYEHTLDFDKKKKCLEVELSTS